MNARVTWLEGLRAMDVVAACLSQPFSGGAVYYGEAGESVSARCMLALIKRCKIRVDLFPVSLSLAKESPEGQTLVYNVSEDMFLCGEKLFKGSMGDRPLRIKNAISCLMSAWLRNRIAFAAIAGSKAKTMRNKNHVIRFERNSMNKMLCRLYEERGFVVKETWGIYEYIRNAKTILSLAKHVVKSKVIPARPRSNIANIRPSVWIEYDKISMIDFTFWKKHTNNALFDIVNYLDRGDTPVTGKITGEIENNGELWVDAHSEAIASNITIPALAALIKGLLRPDDRPFWIKMFDFEYNYWTSAYAAYFKKFKVKILIQHQDTSWKQEAQAAAVESAGGIMMGFHWSNYPLRMTPSHLFPYHVFFEWGKIFDNFLPLEDNLCNYWFP